MLNIRYAEARENALFLQHTRSAAGPVPTAVLIPYAGVAPTRDGDAAPPAHAGIVFDETAPKQTPGKLAPFNRVPLRHER